MSKKNKTTYTEAEVLTSTALDGDILGPDDVAEDEDCEDGEKDCSTCLNKSECLADSDSNADEDDEDEDDNEEVEDFIDDLCQKHIDLIQHVVPDENRSSILFNLMIRTALTLLNDSDDPDDFEARKEELLEFLQNTLDTVEDINASEIFPGLDEDTIAEESVEEDTVEEEEDEDESPSVVFPKSKLN